MRELEFLFQTSFPIEDVIDCRVRRVKAEGLVAAAALGFEPTWLTLTLRDGRVLTTKSRGPGADHDAIQTVIQAITTWKAGEALASLANGQPVSFDAIGFSGAGISLQGRVSSWREIAGWAVRKGGLMWDDASGRLVGEVLLDGLPFPDTVVAIIANRLPDKNYEAMSHGAAPKAGLFSITARTRIPGTFKYQMHVLLGVVPALVALLVLVRVGNRLRVHGKQAANANAPKPYLAWIDEAAAQLASSPAAPFCAHRALAYGTSLVRADKTSLVYHAQDYGWFSGDLRHLSGGLSPFFVWSQFGTDVRLIEWDPEAKRALCIASSAAGTEPLKTAEDLADGNRHQAPPPAPVVAPVSQPSRAQTKKR